MTSSATVISIDDIREKKSSREKELERMLEEERKERMNLETRLAQVEDTMRAAKPRKPKTAKNEEPEHEYNPYTSAGKPKAKPAQSIKSYTDFKAIQDYFLKNGRVRDWALWTIGVSLGVRISDLLSLRVGSLVNPDFSFKPRVTIIEQKTNKANKCLITEAVVYAATKLFESEGWRVDMDDYLFKSRKHGKMTEEYGWKIINDAGKAVGLSYPIGSHSMRKSFANIVACVDNHTIDTYAITKVQGLLNHSDQRTTLRYLGRLSDMYDEARQTVSDFVMGKLDVDELKAGESHSTEDVYEKLESIEKSLLGQSDTDSTETE